MARIDQSGFNRAILSAAERDQHRTAGRGGTKLQRLVVDDRELLGKMFTGSDIAIARDAIAGSCSIRCSMS